MRASTLGRVFLVLYVLMGWSFAQTAASFKKPVPASQLPQKLHPRFHRTDLLQRTPQQLAGFKKAYDAGTLQTLPYWQGSFSIEGKDYNYTLLGQPPQNGGPTTIKTIIVPIRLTLMDYSSDGKNPIVLDATKIVPDILNSPIFRVSDFPTGWQQFGDAMLRAEFPTAPGSWHTLLKPTVAATLDIRVPQSGAIVYESKEGAQLAVITRDNVIDHQLLSMMREGAFAPDEFPIFVTYNATEIDALGYHAAGFREGESIENVFAYTSWLEGVDDLFSVPSPDAATLSHEVAETLHDPFTGDLSSLTLLWGDPFGGNQCFQNFIEVGDAVEDAPGRAVYHEQVIGHGRHARVYTLQNEAMLPWFERKSPSDALGGAYTFPDPWVLKAPAPLACEH
jgi:hypothetical protein